jgi:hypothetical protein
MERFVISASQVEIICLMALRRALGKVRRVRISVTGPVEDGCNWELADVDPMPPVNALRRAMADIQQIQMAFSVEPDCNSAAPNHFRPSLAHEIN